MYLSWTSGGGWALTDRSSSRAVYPLGIDPYSRPAAVASLTRARLAGQPDPDTGSTGWDLAAPLSDAVSAWHDSPATL
ncbi:hypothetical protein ACIQVA_39865 [Streptomyces microflavus]|uniref:hypothetical protein n=1 Tax=Streptomyces microflavus TaxID=1919 RepID=UPI00380896AE